MVKQDINVGTVKVVIAGINGRMGRASARAIYEDAGFELVGAYGRERAAYVGKDVRQLAGVAQSDNTAILVSNGFSECVSQCKPDVLLEFTKAESAVANAKRALEQGIRPVIGASGIPASEMEELRSLSSKLRLGAMIVPNFSVGAVLMIEFARQAASMFSNVEVIEMHNTTKVDAPSGTAMHTLKEMGNMADQFNRPVVQEKELIVGARGGTTESGIRVHSLRFPGLLSHQEVILGSDGELLTIRHDSFNTNCFVKGILLALKSVIDLDHLVIGLDEVLLK